MALPDALTHTRKNRNSLVELRDSMRELHDKHRLAHSISPKESRLTSFDKRAQKVDDLDAGFQNLHGNFGLMQRSWFRENISVNLAGGTGDAIQRFPKHI